MAGRWGWGAEGVDPGEEPKMPQVDLSLYSDLGNLDKLGDVGFEGDDVPDDILAEFEALSREVDGGPPLPTEAAAASVPTAAASKETASRQAPPAAPAAKAAAPAPGPAAAAGAAAGAGVAIDFDALDKIGLVDEDADVEITDADLAEDGDYAAELEALESGKPLINTTPQLEPRRPRSPGAKAARAEALAAAAADLAAASPVGAPKDHLEEDLSGVDAEEDLDGDDADELELNEEDFASDEDDVEEPAPPAVDPKAERIAGIEAAEAKQKRRWVQAKASGDIEGQAVAFRALKSLKAELASVKRLHALESKGLRSDPPPRPAPRSPGPTGGDASDDDAPEALTTLRRQVSIEERVVKLKRQALQEHREGRSEKARALLRQAKELERSLAAAEASASPGGAAPAGAPAPASRGAAGAPDEFTPLEEALREALRRYTSKARELAAVDKKVAMEYLAAAKEAKQLQEELQLRRRVPQAVAPTFQWVTQVKRVRKENRALGMEELELAVEGIRDVPLLLSEGRSSDAETGSAFDFFLKFDLGIPKDEPVTGTLEVPRVEAAAGETPLDVRVKLPMKRSRGTQLHVARRRASVEVWRRRGWFKADEMLGTAQLPLADLLGRCQIGGWTSLSIRATKRESGAALHLFLRQRQPLRDAEIEEVRMQKLVVEPWPAPGSRRPAPGPAPAAAAAARGSARAPPAAAAPSESTVQEVERAERTPEAEADVASARPAARAAAAAKPASMDPGNGLSEQEKRDPLSPNCIVSNHVLEAELTKTTEAMDAARAAGKPVAVELETRAALLEARMNNLIALVQNGQMTPESYLVMVKTTRTNDLRLAMWLKGVGRQVEAANVVRRVHLMDEEIAAATAAMADGGDEEA